MILNEITEILVNLDIDNIKRLVNSALDSGEDPQDVLNALTDGMDKVGKMYEDREYFLTDLILAGETMKDALVILKPLLKTEEKGSKETVICATVKGDNHDIGKNILITLLLSAGFQVIDLGIDVSAEKIINEIKNSDAKVLALSSLLTMTVEQISVVNKALKDAGLRSKIKFIVGGAPLNMKLAKKLGADDYAADCIDGVRHIKQLIEGD
ncbi:MAG: cobalamin-binding protein [Promethearchaeota archaeon]|nr:MAG: cobalamin-binding protein [Candidatus Lokiarchaeota archaeon]